VRFSVRRSAAKAAKLRYSLMTTTATSSPVYIDAADKLLQVQVPDFAVFIPPLYPVSAPKLTHHEEKPFSFIAAASTPHFSCAVSVA
jgi:hypothetical protein